MFLAGLGCFSGSNSGRQLRPESSVRKSTAVGSRLPSRCGRRSAATRDEIDAARRRANRREIRAGSVASSTQPRAADEPARRDGAGDAPPVTTSLGIEPNRNPGACRRPAERSMRSPGDGRPPTGDSDPATRISSDAASCLRNCGAPSGRGFSRRGGWGCRRRCAAALPAAARPRVAARFPSLVAHATRSSSVRCASSASFVFRFARPAARSAATRRSARRRLARA